MSQYPKELFAELERRKVFRVAAIYAVLAWGVLQVGDVVVEPLRLPEWTMTLLIVLVVAGFPFALVLSWMFDLTTDGVRRTADAEPAPGDDPGAPRRAGPSGLHEGLMRRGAWLVVGLLGVVLGAWFGLGLTDRGGPPSGAETLELDAVAVLPFRVSGANAEIHYLREGMVDLLSATLTGDPSPRALDPGTVLGGLPDQAAGVLPRDSALAYARRLGAGLLVRGSIVGTPERLTIAATLLDARTGEPRAEAQATGPGDSIAVLTDRLVAQILSLGAGEARERVGSLAGYPLDAVRAYLEGQAAFRNSRFRDAAEHYRRAIETDSTFALAALRQSRAISWLFDPGLGEEASKAVRLAWRYRERLSAPDRVFLRAYLGPNYPEPSTMAERLDAWRDAVSLSPDRPHAWFQLGEILLHHATAMEQENALRDARAAFERVLAIDSTYGPARGHLMDMAYMRGDSAAVRRMGATAGGNAYHEDLPALYLAALGDSVALDTVRARYTSWPPTFLWLATGLVAYDESEPYVPRDLARRMQTLALERAPTAERRRQARIAAYAHALQWGRPKEALAHSEALMALSDDPTTVLTARIRDALFWDGDAEAAARAADELLPRAEAVTAAEEDAVEREVLCSVALWRLSRGDAAFGASAAATLEGGPRSESGPPSRTRMCGLVLNAWVAAENESLELERLERLDALTRAVPFTGRRLNEANLLLARLWESVGRVDRAYAASRRTSVFLPAEFVYRTTRLETMGRLAAAAGDTAAAVQAYRGYLALRRDAEPALADRVDRVRGELASLLREGQRP